jgi:hydrogenase maturation protein HypF
VSTLCLESRCIEVRGTVQGVGFRPFIHQLATRHALCGWVCNQPSGVQIVVEGTSKAIEEFLQELQRKSPPLARIDGIACASREISGALDFQIHASLTTDENVGCVPADAAVCDDCLRELFDPLDRRYRYPFINCTNCGPRFTIIESLP